MLKKSISAILICGLLFLFAGCGSASVAPSGSQTQEPTPLASSSSVEPTVKALFVTDHLGRVVEVSGDASRIVSGYYITSSMLISLGLEEKIVAIEAKADTRPIYSLAANELLKLPNVGTAKDFNLEGCLALSPDLVILPIKLEDSVKTLSDMGITVIAVDPENNLKMREALTMIAVATGSTDACEGLLADLDARTEKLKALPKEAPPKVYLAGNSSFLSTASSRMYQSGLLELGGGRNVASDLNDNYWAKLSYEQLIAYNPEIIIIAPAASYTKEDLMKDSQLSAVEAVKQGRVYAMPSGIESWDSPVPSSVLGAEWMCSMINEKAYPYEEFILSATKFYKDFYGFDLDPVLLAK